MNLGNFFNRDVNYDIEEMGRKALIRLFVGMFYPNVPEGIKIMLQREMNFEQCVWFYRWLEKNQGFFYKKGKGLRKTLRGKMRKIGTFEQWFKLFRKSLVAFPNSELKRKSLARMLKIGQFENWSLVLKEVFERGPESVLSRAVKDMAFHKIFAIANFEQLKSFFDQEFVRQDPKIEEIILLKMLDKTDSFEQIAEIFARSRAGSKIEEVCRLRMKKWRSKVA